MANPIFLELATQKGGAIKDPDQNKPSFKNQILVYKFDQKLEMSVNYNNAHAGSRARPEPIKFIIPMGCYEVELKQACLSGDSITNAVFSFPVMDKTGVEKNIYTVKATGGIITKVRRVSPEVWQKDTENQPVVVEVEMSYEKLEEHDLVHSKQMSYNWQEL